jgi:hypothetical protein
MPRRAFLALYRGEGKGQDWSGRFRARLPPVDAHLPAREPSKPLTLLLLLNRGCNLRCRFCDLWEGRVDMPLSSLVPLLDEAVAIGTRTLVLTGGEPFLHAGLFDAVRAAKARGMAVNITTNGTLLKRRWDEILQSGVDSISLSLDGLAETHDRLRGRRGAWKATWAALERLVALGSGGASVYSTAWLRSGPASTSGPSTARPISRSRQPTVPPGGPLSRTSPPATLAWPPGAPTTRAPWRMATAMRGRIGAWASSINTA